MIWHPVSQGVEPTPAGVSPRTGCTSSLACTGARSGAGATRMSRITVRDV